MLDYDQRKKLDGVWEKNVTPQKKADFNKKMRRKLKLWLKEIPDMIAILKGLPPRVKDNAKLDGDLPNLIQFMDLFLETIDPLPVGMYKNGEKRVFENVAVDAKSHPSYEDWKENGDIFNSSTGKEYVIRADAWTASPADIIRHDILKKHVNRMQKYIDPSVVVAVTYEQFVEINKSRNLDAKLVEKARLLGPIEASLRWLQANELILTDPPSAPKIIELELDDQG